MRYDIFGNYQIEVRRVESKWRVFRMGNGSAVEIYDLVIPSDVLADEVEGYLNDLLHEDAICGRVIRQL
ncbi:hypothetical protein P3W85_23035 [Cupriavidus basilensis]|uniref:DUF7661 domain-containing protein n=1 Tax=Cupriavidus basilensis TaxID=68895 RepID=A0ABT6AT61_9BURK|nr:hypothetical protein [Cupriavidus basilensis]MDF3835802.1 hypothetical protein [Cupriavidus basilensis]